MDIFSLLLKLELRIGALVEPSYQSPQRISDTMRGPGPTMLVLSV